ncbi:MAG: uracil-DNA glycosylase family protein [Bacteroidales bacterium]|nr:uracil-DNA glycosylase family protein [Bacteroidales bacterium]
MPVESHPFEPFLPPDARILFLGSFPPQPKRWNMPFYYPNWINDFWRIMGLIHFNDRDYFCDVARKRFFESEIRSFCLRAGLAFYDTAAEVRRLNDNASDASLEIVHPTDIRALLTHIPTCGAVVATGQKAAEVIAETFGCDVPSIGNYVDIALGERRLRFWRMPSSSRAYPMSLADKAGYYRLLFQ